MKTTDINEYMESKSLMLALRSIHWFVITLLNRGIPRAITDLFLQGEANLEAEIKNLPLYRRLNPIIKAEIDSFYVSELQPTGRNPEEIWAEAKKKPETFETIRTSLALFMASLERLNKLKFDATPLTLAMNKFADWLHTAAENATKRKDAKAMIDGLNFDTKPGD